MTIRSLFAAPAATALALSACATTGTALSPADHPSGMVHLDLTPHAAARAFPALATSPALPEVDAIGINVQRLLGDEARATVRLCVEPDGAVGHVHLITGSGMDAFDHAALRGVAAWRFAAPRAGAAACEDATIVYRLR